MKRVPDFAIISRIEVGVREPGVKTPNLSGQIPLEVYSLVRTTITSGGSVGAGKGEVFPLD